MSLDTGSDSVFGMISPQVWPLSKIFKNISSERDIIGAPKAEGMPLKSIKEFKFNDSDKRTAVSIALKLILLQRMGMAADKFPLDSLKRQAHLEFVTLFQSLQNVSLYWIIDGVCWLRVLRAQLWNSNQVFLLPLEIPKGILKLKNKDSVIDEYYKVIQKMILGTYLDKSPIKRDSKTLKSLFGLLEFMGRGNFLLILPENFLLVRTELTRIGIEINLVIAVLLHTIAVLDLDSENLEESLKTSLVVLIYIGQGPQTLLDILNKFEDTFPNRLNSLQSELYTTKIVRIDPESEDGLDKRELKTMGVPKFNEKYREYAKKLYFNLG